MLDKLTSFVLPVWVKPVAIALAIAAWTGFWWFKGNEHGTQKLNDHIAEQAKKAVQIAKAQSKVTTEVVTRYVKVKGATEVVTKTVEKEVIKYANANPGYCLDPAWGLLHDDAALNRLAESRPKPDGEVRAPKAAEAIETVTENYAACHRTADRLDALQDWVRKQAAVK